MRYKPDLLIICMVSCIINVVEVSAIDVKIRGAFILNDRDKVREAKGQTGVDEFNRRFNVKVIPTKIYPIKLSLDAQKIAAEIIYGKADDAVFFKLGLWDFKTIEESTLGKAMMSLFARDVYMFIENAYIEYWMPCTLACILKLRCLIKIMRGPLFILVRIRCVFLKVFFMAPLLVLALNLFLRLRLINLTITIIILAGLKRV